MELQCAIPICSFDTVAVGQFVALNATFNLCECTSHSSMTFRNTLVLLKDVHHANVLCITSFYTNKEVVIRTQWAFVLAVDPSHVSACNKRTILNSFFVCKTKPCIFQHLVGYMININVPYWKLSVAFKATYLHSVMSVPDTIDSLAFEFAFSQCDLNSTRHNHCCRIKVFINFFNVIGSNVTLEDRPEITFNPFNIAKSRTNAWIRVMNNSITTWIIRGFEYIVLRTNYGYNCFMNIFKWNNFVGVILTHFTQVNCVIFHFERNFVRFYKSIDCFFFIVGFGFCSARLFGYE